MLFEFNFVLFNIFLFNLYYLFYVRKAKAPTRKTRTPTTRRKNVITFEEGLKTLQEGIVKLFNILEGSEPNFTYEEHIRLY
ncbi:hypothetical protein L195_g042373, partial [Trifolium pratense]